MIVNRVDAWVDADRRESIISTSESEIIKCNTKIQKLKEMNIMLHEMLVMTDDFLLPYNINPLLLIEHIMLNCAQQISVEFNTIFTSRKIWECHHNIEQQINKNLSTINELLEDIKTYKKDIDFFSNKRDYV